MPLAQRPRPRYARAAATLVAATGALLVLCARAIPACLPAQDVLEPLAFPTQQLGCFLLLLAILPARGFHPRAFLALGLTLLTTLLALVSIETLSRQMRWDWKRQEAFWQRLPPFTREPRTPTGSVFFRRHGPEAWTGAVLRASLTLRGRPVPPVYQTEPVIEVRYDSSGFREEPGQKDWDIAIAGDSFTELGCLPHEQIFTTLLARKTGRRIRNLGVSGTGPLTQLHYLEEFGRTPSLRQVGIVFYEGNDLDDLTSEFEARQTWMTTGARPNRDFIPQSSALAALADAWRHGPFGAHAPLESPFVHTFLASSGPIPVHLTEVPLPRRQIPEEALSRFDHFLRAYRDFGQTQRVSTWLAYMPCKARVLHTRLAPGPQLPPGREPWWPPELPAKIAEACRRHGISFIDLTPALVEAAQVRGELVFNPVWEFHLNARGSECVAEELARRLP